MYTLESACLYARFCDANDEIEMTAAAAADAGRYIAADASNVACMQRVCKRLFAAHKLNLTPLGVFTAHEPTEHRPF